MLDTGLLWYDDDTKRPLVEKVAAAVARYGERLGTLPTVCQVNPATAALLAAQQERERQQRRQQRRAPTPDTPKRRSARGAEPPRVRLPQFVADPSIPLNYFLVGVEVSAVPGDAAPREQSTLLPPATVVDADSAHADVSVAPPAIARRPARARRAAKPVAATTSPAAPSLATTAPVAPAPAAQTDMAVTGDSTPRTRRARRHIAVAQLADTASPPPPQSQPVVRATTPRAAGGPRAARAATHAAAPGIVPSTPQPVKPTTRSRRRGVRAPVDVVQPRLLMLDDQPVAVPQPAQKRHVRQRASQKHTPAPSATARMPISKKPKATRANKAVEATQISKAAAGPNAAKPITPAATAAPGVRGKRARSAASATVAPTPPPANIRRRRPAALADAHGTPVEPRPPAPTPRRRAS